MAIDWRSLTKYQVLSALSAHPRARHVVRLHNKMRAAHAVLTQTERFRRYLALLTPVLATKPTDMLITVPSCHASLFHRISTTHVRR